MLRQKLVNRLFDQGLHCNALQGGAGFKSAIGHLGHPRPYLLPVAVVAANLRRRYALRGVHVESHWLALRHHRLAYADSFVNSLLCLFGNLITFSQSHKNNSRVSAAALPCGSMSSAASPS